MNDHEQITRNIQIIGATQSLGLPIEAAFLLGAKPLARKPQEPKALTEQDLQRIAAAEAKRQRKAKKLSGLVSADSAGREKQ